jgi:hypothetical protein
MANKILLNVGYNRYIKLPEIATAEFIVALLGVKSYYEKSYQTGKFKLLKSDETSSDLAEIISVDENELPDANPQIVEMNEVMLENNRLTRENEMLLNKLKALSPSEETAVVVL